MTDTLSARRPDRRRWRLFLPAALLLAGLLLTDAPLAQVNITVDPAMTTGATRAPVTIVEFSDYQ